MFRVHTPIIRSIRCWVAAYGFLHRVFGWVVVLRAAAWVVRMVPCVALQISKADDESGSIIQLIRTYYAKHFRCLSSEWRIWCHREWRLPRCGAGTFEASLSGVVERTCNPQTTSKNLRTPDSIAEHESCGRKFVRNNWCFTGHSSMQLL